MSAATTGDGTSPGTTDLSLREVTATPQAYRVRGAVAFETKRQFDRFVVALKVTYTRDGERVEALSRDVSLGGMFIETELSLPYGTKFELAVTLPALAQPALIDATVRWVGPTGMGVQWGALHAKETWAINQLTKP